MTEFAVFDFNAGPEGGTIPEEGGYQIVPAGVTNGTVTYDSTPTMLGAFHGKITSQSGSKYLGYTLPNSVAEGWLGQLVIVPETNPTESIFFSLLSNGTNRASDLRWGAVAGGSRPLVIRDLNTARNTDTAPLIPVGTLVRVHHKSKPSGATGVCRVRAWWGSNLWGSTPNYDSGDLANTSSIAGTINNARWGIVIAPAVAGNTEVEFDRVVVADAEPGIPAGVGGATNPVVTMQDNFGEEPFNANGSRRTVTLAATSDQSSGTWAWRQVSPADPALTLAGSGAGRTFQAPFLRRATQFTFGAIHTVSGRASDEKFVVVTVAPVREWIVKGGVEIPRVMLRVTA